MMDKTIANWGSRDDKRIACIDKDENLYTVLHIDNKIIIADESLVNVLRKYIEGLTTESEVSDGK